MRQEPEAWDCDDRCWAIIAELDKVPIEARFDRLNNGVAFVRVSLDDLYTVDCQIDLAADFKYTVYIRRYSPVESEGVVAQNAPYQANHFEQAAKCIELAYRCHEVQVRDGYEQMLHMVEAL